MTAMHPHHVHQAYLGWSHDTGQVTMLVHSFPSAEVGRHWYARLNEHVRLQPMGSAEAPPASALSYLDFGDGTVAVLRRLASGFDSGRNDSHALIGSAGTLTVRHALGLSMWTGWLDQPDPWLRNVLRADDVDAFADHTGQLEQRACQLEQRLTAVLPALLERPGEPLTIIGCPDSDRLAMVWGLFAAADEYLRSRGLHRTWSFSTYERRHDAQVDALPEIVFMPALQIGTAPVSRTIVNLNGPVEASQANRGLATMLLSHVFRGAPLPAASPQELTTTRTVHPDQETPGHQPQEGGFTLVTDERRHVPPATPPSNSRQTRAQPERARLSIPQTLESLERLISDLQHDLKYLPDREPARAAVDPATLDELVVLAERAAPDRYLSPLLQVVYGPELVDLRSTTALDHAVAVIRTTRSERLARELIRAGAENARVAEAGLQRWVDGRQPPEQVVKPGVPFRLPRRQARLVVSIAAAALLGLAFLLGIAAGTPDDGVTAAPVAGPASTNLAPMSTRTVPPVQFQVTDVAAVANGKSVFSFVKADDGKLYPQQPCNKLNETVWLCAVTLSPAIADGTLLAYPVTDKERHGVSKAAAEDKPITPAAGEPLAPA